jgi:archaellum biogenesis ATPase FlaH
VLQFLLNYNEFSGYKSLSFSFFNKKLKGLRMGEFTIFTGETGSGKTTFLTQLSLDFLIQRVPTLWGSFEIKNDRLTSLFLMQYAKKELRNAKAEEIEYYYENFDKLPLYLYKFHGSQNIDQVLSTIEYATYNYDIQTVVLDNLQFMIGSPSVNVNKFDLQDEIIFKLRKFATEKNVHIILVIHPKKTDDALTISSIFGTGKASQEADNIFILQSLKGLRVIEIAKNRFDGSTGKTVIGFDQATCRFFELTEDEFTQIHQGKSKLENIIENRKSQYGSVEIKVKDNSFENSKLLEIPGNKDFDNVRKTKESVEFTKKDNLDYIKEVNENQGVSNVTLQNEFNTSIEETILFNKLKGQVDVSDVIAMNFDREDETIKQLITHEAGTNPNTPDKGVLQKQNTKTTIVKKKQTPVTSEVKNSNDGNVSQTSAVKKEKVALKAEKEVHIPEAQINNTEVEKLTQTETKITTDSIVVKVSEPKPKVKGSSNINIPRVTQTERFAFYEESEDAFSEIKTFQRILFPNTNIVNTFHTEDSLEKAKTFSSVRKGSYKKNSGTIIKETQQKPKIFTELFDNSKK